MNAASPTDAILVKGTFNRGTILLNATVSLYSEARYLKANPDVLEAIKDGRIRSARSHYDLYGKREGRGWSDEEVAYLEGNPDVLDAIRDGRFGSAWEHYQLYGKREGRMWR